MFSKTERMLAFRYLKSRKRTGFVSVIAGFSFLGIMLGVATLIIVMSVMNGFKDELMTRVLGINGQLGVYPTYGPFLENSEEKINVMQGIKDIAHVVPVVDGQVMVSSEVASAGVMVRGMDKEDFKKRPLLGGNYKGLDVDEFLDSQIILGYRLARRLGLRAGDTVSLVSPKGNITAFGTIPKMKAYTVLGTFDSGMSEYDANFLFMPLDEAKKFFVTGDRVSHLEIFTAKYADYEKIARQAFDKIGRDAQIQDWRYSNQAFFNAIEVERNVMFLILTLIIIVAAFNMISGLIMLVQDKTKDIAVLRTMGMSRGAIQRIFLMSGLMVGFVGTFAGFGLGLLFCENIDAIKEFLEGLSGKELFSAEIYFLSKLPAKVEMTEVTLVVVMSLVLSLLATLYPSYKASKTDPVEALRYE